MNATNTQPNAADDNVVDLFDYAKIKDYFLFVIGAVRRHLRIVLPVFGLVVALSFLFLAMLPNTYHAEAKLLGQRNQVISALAVPGRVMPNEADAPARAAGETIKSRDSLLNLIKQTDLVKHFYSHRSRGGAAKDWLLALFGRYPSEEEKIESVLGLLDQRLTVNVSTSWQGEGTVNISVDWPDPLMAHHIVETAQQHFLETRHVTELSNISEAVSILEGNAAEARQAVDTAAEELDKVRTARAAQGGRIVSATQIRRRPPIPSHDLMQLDSMVQQRERAIADLEDNRRRRLAELQMKQNELRSVYSEAHPVMIDIEQSIRAGGVDSAPLIALRNELAELKAEYARRGGGAEHLSLAAPLPSDVVRVQVEPKEIDSGEEYTKSHMLQLAVTKYMTLEERIDSAKTELEAARAAFKYRYTVVQPPLLPTKPIRPKVFLILFAGTIAALLLSLLTAVAMDILSGEIVERWQVERQLQLPVFAELPWS